jgi:hypothetical protein
MKCPLTQSSVVMKNGHASQPLPDTPSRYGVQLMTNKAQLYLLVPLFIHIVFSAATPAASTPLTE